MKNWHYLTSLIFCGFINITVFAQKPKITDNFSLDVGPKYKRVNHTGDYLFQYGSHLLSLKKLTNSFVAQRFSSGNLTKSTATSSVNDKGALVSVMQLKDTVLIYYSKNNKLIAQKLRISVNKPAETNTILDFNQDISDDFGFSSRFGYDAGNRINAFGIKKSVAESHYVIVSRDHKNTNLEQGLLKNITNGKALKNLSNNIYRTLNINVYQADRSLLWNKKIALPYRANKMNTDDFMVDNAGNFYVLASVFDKERVATGKRNKEDSDFHMEVFKLSEEKDTWEIYKIETSKSIEDAVLYTQGEDPVLLGFYAEEILKGFVTGCFKASLVSDKNLIKPILHPIPTDTLKAYSNRKNTQINNGQRKKRELEDLEKIQINKVTTTPDGSFTLFAEQRFASRNSYYANGATVVKYDYYYKTAYACKGDGVGNILWFNQLPKNQYGKNGKQAMSYQVLERGNHYHLLIWEKFSNLYKSIGDAVDQTQMDKKAYMFIASYKIDKLSGEVSKLPVLNSLEVDKYKLRTFSMDKGVLINNSELLLEGDDGRSNYLFKLNLVKN